MPRRDRETGAVRETAQVWAAPAARATGMEWRAPDLEARCWHRAQVNAEARRAVQTSGFGNAEAATQLPAKSAPKAADEAPRSAIGGHTVEAQSGVHGRGAQAGDRRRSAGGRGLPGVGTDKDRGRVEGLRARIGRIGRPRGAADSLQTGIARRACGGFSGCRSHRVSTGLLIFPTCV